MKKLFKSIICLVMAASLCIMSTGFVFASESFSDISLDDLLNLLSQLTGGDEDADGEDIDDIAEVTSDGSDMTNLTIGAVSFDIPTEWYENEEESDDGTYSYFASDYSKWATITFSEDLGDEQIDLTDSDQVDLIVEMLSGEDDDVEAYVVTVCGLPALQINAAYEDFTSFSLILPVDDDLFMFGVSGFEDASADFTASVDSIQIEGADGATDLAAAPAGNTESAPADKTASAAEGIDATAVDEVVLVDDDNITVTIKNFSEDDYYAMTAKIFVENKTDINLYVTFDDVSVNGYMCDPWWGTSVSAGHKSNSDLHFYQDDIEESGIENIRDIEFTLRARDDDDYSADYIVDETFVVYPYGMDVPEQPEPTFADDAIVMADTDEVKMILTGFSEDNYYVYGYVYLENNTDTELEYKVSGDSTVNGYELSPYFYKDVMPGKKMFTSMTWSVSELDDNDIETIEDMELELEISDSNDWSADPIYEDVIYITFE